MARVLRWRVVFFGTVGLLAGTAAMLSGCGGGTPPFTSPSNAGVPAALAQAGENISSKPAKLSLRAGESTSAIVSEKGYAGRLTSASTGRRACKNIATWEPKRGKGPRFKVHVRGAMPGSCAIVFSDGKHSIRLPITVRTPAPSPSPSSTPTASPTPTSTPTPFHIPGTLYVTTLEGPGYEGLGNVEEFIGAMSSGGPGPWATISGPATEIGNPAGIGVDATGNVYVAMGANSSYECACPIVEYSAYSNGNASPIGHTTLNNGSGSGIAIDASGDLYVSVTTLRGAGAPGQVYTPNGNGYYTRARNLGVDSSSGGGIALDASGRIYLSVSSGSDSSPSYAVDTFSAGATSSGSNSAPVATIAGPATEMSNPLGVAVDSSGNVYVAQNAGNAITVYAAGSSGNVAPIRTITGSRTGLGGVGGPSSLALDANGNIYVASGDAGFSFSGSLLVFAAGANGNVAPIVYWSYPEISGLTVGPIVTSAIRRMHSSPARSRR